MNVPQKEAYQIVDVLNYPLEFKETLVSITT